VFERFSEGARRVVVLAQEEARGLNHPFIGVEHLLLGLLREEEGIAARALQSAGVSIDEIRADVGRRIPGGEPVAAGQMPFTPAAKETLEFSLREALELRHNYIGTEHVLLALLREADALRLLSPYGVRAEALREQVVSLAIAAAGPPRIRPRVRRGRAWDYHVVALEGPITEEWLASFGNDGWEFVTVVGDRAVFKRPA
jgi:ATP-dependent Clp protease ATP-binding subunit ClpA